MNNHHWWELIEDARVQHPDWVIAVSIENALYVCTITDSAPYVNGKKLGLAYVSDVNPRCAVSEAIAQASKAAEVI